MGVLDDENADRNRNSTADRDRQGSGNNASNRSSGSSGSGGGYSTSSSNTSSYSDTGGSNRSSGSSSGGTGYGEGSGGGRVSESTRTERERRESTSTGTGYGAGGSRSPGYTATPTATTPSPSRSTTTTTGLGTGFDTSRFGDIIAAPTTRGLGNGLTPEERALIGRSGVDYSASAFLSPMPVSEGTQAERARRGAATTSAVRIDPSEQLMNLSLQTVAGLENFANVDPYHGVFGKKAGNPALTTMTLGEVKAYQKTLKNTPVGAYQMTDDTLKVAARLAGVTDSTIMTKEVWDRMGAALVKERARLATGKDGKIDVNKFATELSKEWAALADPKTGRSHYHGTAGNKARANSDVTMELANDFALALESGAATAVAAAAPVAAAATTRYDEVYSGGSRSALTMGELVSTQLPSGSYSDPTGADRYVDPYAAVRPPAAEGPSVREDLGERGRKGLDLFVDYDFGAATNDRIALPQSAPIDERALIDSTQLPSGSYRDPQGLDLYQNNPDFTLLPERQAVETRRYDLTNREGIKEFQRDHGLKEDGIYGPLTQAALNKLDLRDMTSSDYDFNTKEGIKEFQRDMGLKVDGIIGPRTQEAIDNLPSEGDVDPMTTGAVATPAAIPDLATAPKAPFVLEPGEVRPTSSIVDRVTAAVHAVMGPGWEVYAISGHRGTGGSGRHNQKALDFQTREIATGRVLDYRNPDDAALMDRIALTGAGSFGTRGTGIGKNYMNGTAIHLDIFTDLRPDQDNEWRAMNAPEKKAALAAARASYEAGEAYNVEAYDAGATEDRTPGSAVEQADAWIAERAAAATTPDGTVHAAPNAAADAAARAANAHAPANTTAGQGYYSNITQRGLGTDLKPTRPPTGVSAEDYKRGLAGHVGANGIDMLIGGSIAGIGAQVVSALFTGDTIGGNIVDNIAGQGRTNYYQPGDLDRQSDSSGEVARTSAIPTGPIVTVTGDGTTTTATTGNDSYEGLPTFEDKYLGGGTTTTSTYPTPAEKWGLKPNFGRSNNASA